MLNPKRTPLKTYDELMEENLNKIPIYSDEWTNFNPSDPAITTLETLSAIQIMQGQDIDSVTPAVKAKLLNMLGYSQKKGRSAEVFLQPKGIKEPLDIPSDQRFMVGDISFETTLPRRLFASHLTGVYGRRLENTRDLSFLLEKDVALFAEAFGRPAKAGAELIFVMNEPIEAGETAVIYIDMDEKVKRNPFDKDRNFSFASIDWQCYTASGFVSMEVVDETECFVQSGYLRFTQPEGQAALYEKDGISGYVWRAVLREASYDIIPVIKGVTDFLFPVYQKKTMVINHSFQNPSSVIVNSAMLENGYVRVYAKEQKGTSYMRYAESIGEEVPGRYYRKERLDYGKYAFKFDKEAFGYAPGKLKNAVKVVLYNEEMMRRYFLGEILGYDNQEIALPCDHVVTSTFSIIAERENEQGEKIYDFLKPGRGGEREMYYLLYENEGKILVRNPGAYIGAKLYLGSIAVNIGNDGNVRRGNEFFPVDLEGGEGIRFFNPTVGTGGCYQESLEDVRKRFVQDLSTPQTAVIAYDYESLAARTPGLCIRKVKAWMDADRNAVQVAVLPVSEDKFPQLSDKYMKELTSFLDERRLLCTSLAVRQPVYTAVFTSGTIYVKPHYTGCRQQIEEVIRRQLDYITGSQNFGQVLRFDHLFHAIESLECVSYIYELSISPASTTNAKVDGTDIIPDANCLLYPGNMKLDILPLPEGNK